MTGNVDEFCQDVYTPDRRGGLDPQGVAAYSSSRRVVRGGANDSKWYRCRISERSYYDPSDNYFNVSFGFRVVFISVPAS